MKAALGRLFVFLRRARRDALDWVMDYELKVRNPEMGRKERVLTNIVRTGKVLDDPLTLN